MAYFFSRCTGNGNAPPEALGVSTWKVAYERFHPACGEGRDLARFRNSLKNARDSFDSHDAERTTRLARRGSRDSRQVGAIPAAILSAWGDRSDAELFAVIEELLWGPDPTRGGITAGERA